MRLHVATLWHREFAGYSVELFSPDLFYFGTFDNQLLSPFPLEFTLHRHHTTMPLLPTAVITPGRAHVSPYLAGPPRPFQRLRYNGENKAKYHR